MISEIRPLPVDQRFASHFGQLRQVFLYITDRCNLSCEYCLYKPNLTFQLRKQEVDPGLAMRLLATFQEMGATKLSLIGGEPTLYDQVHQNAGLLDVIHFAKQIGYRYVRMDTNGVFDNRLLCHKGMRLLDELSISLDGYKDEVNDVFRGSGTFAQAVDTLREAVRLGYKVDVTICVHKANTGRDPDGRLVIDNTIRYFESLGVNRVNLHPVLRMGIPRDTWTACATIEPAQWTEVFAELAGIQLEGGYRIPVRLPQRAIGRDEFAENSEYYGYCSAKLGERVLVHPDGIIRCCALLIGTPFGIARYDNDRISWDSSWTNELSREQGEEHLGCSVQRKSVPGGIPLCISFKPNQDEYIWKKELNWDDRRKVDSELVEGKATNP